MQKTTTKKLEQALMDAKLQMALDKEKGINKMKKYLSDTIIAICDDKEDLKLVSQFMETISIQDTIETMLAIQMFNVHYMTCKLAKKESNAGLIRKLCNTFVSQMQMYRKHKNKEDRKVIIEYKYTKEKENKKDIIDNILSCC